MKKFFNLKTLIFLILSFSIVVFLITILDFDVISKVIGRVKYKYIFLASLCYLCSNLMKTIRFKLFFREEKLNLFRLFSVVSYHNFFNQIMPARTGELTLVYYLKRICKTDVSSGVHSLLVVRFLDLFMVAVFFLISFIFAKSESVDVLFIIAAIIFGLIALTIVLFLNHAVRFGYFIFKKFINLTGLKNIKIICKIDEKLEDLVKTFNSKSITKKIPSLAFSSIFVWLALYTFSYCIIRGFSVDLTYAQSVLGATASVLTNVLPINSFGSFGTMEAGWVGGYYLVGVEKDVAVISAFTYHLVNFFTAGFIALVCKIILGFKGSK